MRDDWLIDVLRDIEDYALQHQLTWLAPLVEKAQMAALRELTHGAPIVLGRHRSLNRRTLANKQPAQANSPSVEVLEFQLLKTQRPTSQS